MININNAELVISAGRPEQLLPGGICEVAFSGRSNSGKSSMLNKLLNRKSLARTSSEPGKTATVNYYLVDGAVYLVDLPGYGYAKTSETKRQAWGYLTEAYLSRNTVSLAVQLIDSRHGPTEADRLMLNWLRRTGVPFAVAMTKADKLKPSRRAEESEAAKSPEYAGAAEVMYFSSVTGEGRDRLWALIEAAAGRNR